MGLQPDAPEAPRPGVGALAAQAPNPHGSLMAKADAVKRVLEEMAETEPTFAPFAQRAITVIESGAAAVTTAPVGPVDGAAMPPGGPGGAPAMGGPAY